MKIDKMSDYYEQDKHKKDMSTYEKQWEGCDDDVTPIQFVIAHSWLDDYTGDAFEYLEKDERTNCKPHRGRDDRADL
jgi:hypothetical protein